MMYRKALFSAVVAGSFAASATLVEASFVKLNGELEQTVLEDDFSSHNPGWLLSNGGVIENGELGPTEGVSGGQARWIFDIEPEESGNTPYDVTGMQEVAVYFTMRTVAVSSSAAGHAAIQLGNALAGYTRVQIAPGRAAGSDFIESSPGVDSTRDDVQQVFTLDVWNTYRYALSDAGEGRAIATLHKFDGSEWQHQSTVDEEWIRWFEEGITHLQISFQNSTQNDVDRRAFIGDVLMTTTIPEPSAAAAMITAGSMLLFRRNRSESASE